MNRMSTDTNAVDDYGKSTFKIGEAGGGRILTLLSSSVKKPIDNLTLSNTFRPAVYGLCKSLSLELAGDHIQVNGLAPGRIAKGMASSPGMPAEPNRMAICCAFGVAPTR